MNVYLFPVSEPPNAEQTLQTDKTDLLMNGAYSSFFFFLKETVQK